VEHSCIDFLKLRTIEYPMYYKITAECQICKKKSTLALSKFYLQLMYDADAVSVQEIGRLINRFDER
jgi:hypothetical protein